MSLEPMVSKVLLRGVICVLCVVCDCPVWACVRCAIIPEHAEYGIKVFDHRIFDDTVQSMDPV